ncbi:uncharacterized protein LOC143908433 [Temnothorax americanus]|uniref:uncharacterized protein LOC143908433 n=1 Tax=Temnothorax americanus TaxID=1964332 RepID=UPI004067D83B
MSRPSSQMGARPREASGMVPPPEAGGERTFRSRECGADGQSHDVVTAYAASRDLQLDSRKLPRADGRRAGHAGAHSRKISWPVKASPAAREHCSPNTEDPKRGTPRRRFPSRNGATTGVPPSVDEPWPGQPGRRETGR